jgi:hypothetical protein
LREIADSITPTPLPVNESSAPPCEKASFIQNLNDTANTKRITEVERRVETNQDGKTQARIIEQRELSHQVILTSSIPNK